MTAHTHPDPAGADAARLREIRERAEKASKPPWFPFPSPWPDKMDAVTHIDQGGPPICYVGTKGQPNDANRDFIAHARADVPWLLDAYDRLTREVAAYAKATDEWAEQFHREAEARIDATEKAMDAAERAEAAEAEVERLRGLLAEEAGDVERLRAAIHRVLDDEESRPGAWGPDVTCVAILRAALAPGDGRGEGG